MVGAVVDREQPRENQRRELSRFTLPDADARLPLVAYVRDHPAMPHLRLPLASFPLTRCSEFLGEKVFVESLEFDAEPPPHPYPVPDHQTRQSLPFAHTQPFS